MRQFWPLNLLALATLPAWFLTFETLFQPTIATLNTSLVIGLVVLVVILHEVLHYGVVKVIAPHLHVTFTLHHANPSVRIEGVMSLRTRLIFLLTPLLVISVACWVIADVAPATAVTCVILAATNASCSTSDLWRSFTLLVRVTTGENA